MTGRTPEPRSPKLDFSRNLNLRNLVLKQDQRLKIADLSSKTLRLSPEDFDLDEQGRITIDKEKLAKAIQEKLLKEGEPNLSASTAKIEVGVTVKFP
jgi:hypothetical protein